eukprot:scaffold2905_cov175-Prasinococcus_capsulatus_cf.AAC.1
MELLGDFRIAKQVTTLYQVHPHWGSLIPWRTFPAPVVESFSDEVLDHRPPTLNIMGTFVPPVLRESRSRGLCVVGLAACNRP